MRSGILRSLTADCADGRAATARADEPPPTPAPRTESKRAAGRVRAKLARSRRRRGLAVFSVCVREDRLIEALLRHGSLSEAASRDPAQVANAMATVLEDWARYWLR